MIELVEHRDAFECLFRENYTRLFYHAFSFLNDEEEAKDVVNDVFERVWMNFEKLEFSSSLVPLLYTLVRNRCVSLIRHKKVKERFFPGRLKWSWKIMRKSPWSTRCRSKNCVI